MNTGLLFVTLVMGFGLMIMGLFSGDRSDRTRLILVVAGVLSLLATLVIGLLGVLGPGRANIVEWQPAGASQGFEARCRTLSLRILMSRTFLRWTSIRTGCTGR